MKQEEQIANNAMRQILEVLTPEQRKEYQLAQQENREPNIQLTATQASLMQFIAQQRDDQLLTRMQFTKYLLEQLNQKKVERERQTN